MLPFASERQDSNDLTVLFPGVSNRFSLGSYRELGTLLFLGVSKRLNLGSYRGDCLHLHKCQPHQLIRHFLVHPPQQFTSLYRSHLTHNEKSARSLVAVDASNDGCGDHSHQTCNEAAQPGLDLDLDKALHHHLCEEEGR